VQDQRQRFRPLKAGFTAAPTQGLLPLMVQFTDATTPAGWPTPVGCAVGCNRPAENLRIGKERRALGARRFVIT